MPANLFKKKFNRENIILPDNIILSRAHSYQSAYDNKCSAARANAFIYAKTLEKMPISLKPLS